MRFLNVTWAKLSLRARMLVLTGAVLIGSGGIFQYAEAQRTVDEYRKDISAEMDNTMDLLVLAIAEHAVAGDYGAIRRILGTRVEKPLIDEIRWRDRDGRVLEAKSSEIAPRAPALFARLIDLKPGVQSREIVAGGHYGTVSARFTGVLHENLLWDRYLRQLASLVAHLAALFFVTWFLLKSGLKPIEDLAAAARRFLAGDLEAHVKISPGMPPEIRDTLRMVNRAADSIGSLVLSLSEVRRATDNAAIVVESDLNGVITYANDKFCEISGYSLAELVGSDHRFLNSGHHPPSFFAELWATVSQGNVWRGEVCNRTKNGGLFWTNTTITPIVGPDGKPLKYVAIRFDTTRRKLAESKLWQQAQIIEQTHDAVFSMDPDGNVASWNRGAERLFGYSREEAMGRPIRFLCPDEECDFFRVEALKAKGADSLETALRRKSGEHFDAHLSLTMLRDRNGAVIGMVGYAIDITARKLAENALRESEAGLALAQQMAHIGNWEWNIEKNTLRWSEEIYRIFGLAPQQFGASYEAFLKMVHPNDLEYVQAAINAALRGSASYNIDHRIVLPDGRLRFVHEQAEVTFDQNGRAIRMVGTVQDITERKRAMEELDRFKNVLDNTLDMIFMFDPDTLHFVYLNRGAVEGMGYRREELLRMTAYQIKPLLPEPVFRELIAPLLSGEKPSLSFETVHRHKDGTDFPVEIFLQLVKQGEGKGLFIAIGRDITERKRAEMEIRESREQLRELSSYIQTAREQEKAKIAREIHDELGSTLTALKMDAFWLAKKLPAEMDALREKIASMTKLVDSAVHATRRIATELRPTVLDDIGLKAAIEWQASEFQNRMGIRCEVDLGQDEIELDEARSIALFRIFQESLTNIARHANASHVSARLRRSGDHIAMSIRDNGRGVSQERILKSTSHGVRGMFERARHFGGNVTVEGTEGRGTTITVHIPLVDREETETVG